MQLIGAVWKINGRRRLRLRSHEPPEVHDQGIAKRGPSVVDDVLRLEVVADRAVAPVDERHPSSGEGGPNQIGRESAPPVFR